VEFLGSREGIAKAKAELLYTTAEGGAAGIPIGEPVLAKPPGKGT
jgi:UDP-N-acetylmuramyl pentapeptide synthase